MIGHLRRCEQGSVLILMPAIVLVLLILGAISVDSAIAYLGHRQLQDFTATAADQIAVQALDRNAFYGGEGSPGGRLEIDSDEAQSLARDLAAQVAGGGVRITDVAATVIDGGQGVEVSATGTVNEVFGAAVGGQTSVRLSATSTASLAEVRVSQTG